MTQWQPIETAPRDGTEILVVAFHGSINNTTTSCYSLVRYIDGDWVAQANGDTVMEDDPNISFVTVDCKYWHPLPPAPETR